MDTLFREVPELHGGDRRLQFVEVVAGRRSRSTLPFHDEALAARFTVARVISNMTIGPD